MWSCVHYVRASQLYHEDDACSAHATMWCFPYKQALSNRNKYRVARTVAVQGLKSPFFLEFYTGEKPAFERTVNIDMASSMVIYHRSIPADIAFVAQIDNSWNMKRNIEEVLEVARGYNRDRHMFSLPSKYDIFFPMDMKSCALMEFAMNLSLGGIC